MKQGRRSQRDVPDSATLVEDVLDLRALCLVVDLGSVTDAARRMGESKATVSRRISRLEAAVGVSLVRRSPRLVEATEDGAAYRERIGDVLDMLGAAHDAARRATTIASGTLRVTSGPEFNAVLAPLVVAFAEQHPAVKVEMVVTQAALDLDREGIDVALRVARQLTDSSLIAHKVVGLEAIVVGSPSYLRAHRAVRLPTDLARHRMATLVPARARSLAFRHRTSGRVYEVPIVGDLRATDMSFLVEIALSGGGLTLVPALAVRRGLEQGALVRLLSDYDVGGASLFLLHRASRFLPPKVLAFREFVLRSLRDGRPEARATTAAS